MKYTIKRMEGLYKVRLKKQVVLVLNSKNAFDMR